MDVSRGSCWEGGEDDIVAADALKKIEEQKLGGEVKMWKCCVHVFPLALHCVANEKQLVESSVGRREPSRVHGVPAAAPASASCAPSTRLAKRYSGVSHLKFVS